jgi:hypothetical protein
MRSRSFAWISPHLRLRRTSASGITRPDLDINGKREKIKHHGDHKDVATYGFTVSGGSEHRFW